MEILSEFISRRESTAGARNDRGITNGAKRRNEGRKRRRRERGRDGEREGGERQKRVELPANVTTPLMQKRTKCRQVLPP